MLTCQCEPLQYFHFSPPRDDIDSTFSNQTKISNVFLRQMWIPNPFPPRSLIFSRTKTSGSTFWATFGHQNPNLYRISYEMNRSISKKISRNFSRVKIEKYLLYIWKNASLKTHGTWTVASFFFRKYIPINAQIWTQNPSLAWYWEFQNFALSIKIHSGRRHGFRGRGHGCARQTISLDS